ncbi:MAG: LapA family protein [Tabrizicola sp.]|nr:LapA family protein [Tabrizicola sp.]
MIRYLRYIFLSVLGLVLLTVALANRGPVQLRLLPDDITGLVGSSWQIELPLFLVIFASIIAGLMIGFFWEWVREMKHRSVATTKAREVTRLERELAVLRDSASMPEDDVLALLERPKAQ